MRAGLTRNLCGLIKRGSANPATSELASRLRAGLREVRSAVGGAVDADSSSWWACLELKGPTKEASQQGCGDARAQMRDWLISNPTDLSEDEGGYIANVLRDADHRQLAPKLWLAATAEKPMASDLEEESWQ